MPNIVILYDLFSLSIKNEPEMCVFLDFWMLVFLDNHECMVVIFLYILPNQVQVGGFRLPNDRYMEKHQPVLR